MQPLQVIGRGTWLDQVAARVIRREEKLGRPLSLIRVESGFSASGTPHVGTAADILRGYGIKLAVEEQGYRSELIAFSDDMDGLRSVPAGFPDWLQNHICHPVYQVPDPQRCHESYAGHTISLLQEVLERIGVEYRLYRGSEVYRSGLLAPQMRKILENSSKIGQKAAEILGQTKFLKVQPYFPVCANCHRVYVAQAHTYLPKEGKVLYRCLGETVGRRWVKGCGFQGEVDPCKGPGKLSWKGEFAARWQALEVRFEAYGKDLLDSVHLNDWISDEILGYPHPYHVRFEHFVAKTGKKLSKSTGLLITPQQWLQYATPQSLLLLMFKRIVGTRSLSLEDIPKYMGEYQRLETLYFTDGEANPRERAKLRGLYEYVNLLKPPSTPSTPVPYLLLAQLASVAPPDALEQFVLERLQRCGLAKKDDPTLPERIRLAAAWARDHREAGKAPITLNNPEREAVKALALYLRQQSDPSQIQNRVFEIARSHDLEPQTFFRILYQIFFGQDRGPRLGPYLVDIGRERATQILLEAAAK